MRFLALIIAVTMVFAGCSRKTDQDAERLQRIGEAQRRDGADGADGISSIGSNADGQPGKRGAPGRAESNGGSADGGDGGSAPAVPGGRGSDGGSGGSAGEPQTTPRPGESSEEFLNRLETEAGERGYEVDISEFRYSPSQVRITKGTKVRWINRGDEEHTASPFTKRIKPGQSATYVFEFAGSFPFYCEIHGRNRMSGVVKVS